MRSRSASLAFALLLGAALGRAQTTGTIEGRILNSLGSPLPGVTVEATSPRLQGSRVGTSDTAGRVRLSSLPPGLYTVRARLAGFQPAEKSADLPLDATVTVDFVLEPAATEAVVVHGQAPQIDTTSTTTGTSYGSGVIQSLPVDRNYADIVRSNPGVGTDRGETQGRSLALTIYGSTSAENKWLIDGIDTTSVIKGIQGKAINNEFIEEVEVKTGGYPAEYGGAMGGVINVVTKSGGNTYHGDVFVYYDTAAMTAPVRTDTDDSSLEQIASPRYRLDAGADVGGFILKDRLWFYGAYNRVEDHAEVWWLEGWGEVTPQDRFPIDTTEDLYSGKLTWNATPSTTAVATVFADPSTIVGAELGAPVSLAPATWVTDRSIGGTDFGARLTHLFGSSAIGVIQAGVHHDRWELDGVDLMRTEDWRCEGGSPKSPCDRPRFPLSATGGFAGAAARYDFNRSEREQYGGGVTAFAGSHELKAGGQYRGGLTEGQAFFGGGQTVHIYNEHGQRYYAHRYVAVSATDPTPVPDYRPSARTLGYSAYVADSWRATPNLTLNLGLRWDGEDVQDLTGDTVLKSRDQWQPRIGAVWSPGSDGRTKVSAFAGRFAYDLPTVTAIVAFHGFTILETYNFDPVSLTPDPKVFLQPENPLLWAGGGLIGDPVDHGVGLFYQDELILGAEHAVDPTLTIGLKGTYRRLGRAIEERCDFESTGEYNQCALINPGSGELYAAGDVTTCNHLDPPYDACDTTGPPTPPARRLYRGLELFARKTVGETLWAQASYVYSSLKGNYDGAVNEAGGTEVGANGDFGHPAVWHNGYGFLALDRTHRFRLDGYWNSPWRVSLGLQFFVETGAPFDRLGYYSEYLGTVVRLDPRGTSGRLPTLWDANLILGYPITIGPVTATLQAYFYNVFNNQIPVAVDTGWTFGPSDNYPDDIDDPNRPSENDNYGKVTERYAPRSVRAAVRISF
ncbi:MAG: TonB-dependent receptor [Thermoanaerobaculia bacterium]